jgi:2'-5' RNA ligase
MSKDGAHSRLQSRYNRLWSATIKKIRDGNIEPDPVLAAGMPDRRRGLTVIARPSPDVRQRVAAFLRQLRRLEPDQYYYAPSELHLTVLSLFTATANYRQFLAQAGFYVSAVDAALRKVAPIRIEFSGVTASSGAIMIQGFFENEALNKVRDALRRQLRIRGLAEGVDGRYRLRTAHMTVARFRAPLRDGTRFAALLEDARHRTFGETNIRSVNLVKNDWYMTRGVLKIVKHYRLSRSDSNG